MIFPKHSPVCRPARENFLRAENVAAEWLVFTYRPAFYPQKI